MFKVLKNEIIKMYSGKKFYVLSAVLIASIVTMAVLGKGDVSSEITANNFVTRTLFGMIMKPVLPMFMVLVIAEALTEDYTHGTMKFSLMTPVTKTEFILGKLIFIATYAVILLIVSFIGSYIVGGIVFGLGNRGEVLNIFVTNIKGYTSVVFPLMSFCMVISLLALLINNSGALIGLGIGIDVIMMMVDSQIKNAVYYTFSGGMYSYISAYKLGTYNIPISSFKACIYVCVGLLFCIAIIKKKDIVL